MTVVCGLGLVDVGFSCIVHLEEWAAGCLLAESDLVEGAQLQGTWLLLPVF